MAYLLCVLAPTISYALPGVHAKALCLTDQNHVPGMVHVHSEPQHGMRTAISMIMPRLRQYRRAMTIRCQWRRIQSPLPKKLRICPAGSAAG
jgi:hypothetical protein